MVVVGGDRWVQNLSQGYIVESELLMCGLKVNEFQLYLRYYLHFLIFYVTKKSFICEERLFIGHPSPSVMRWFHEEVGL